MFNRKRRTITEGLYATNADECDRVAISVDAVPSERLHGATDARASTTRLQQQNHRRPS